MDKKHRQQQGGEEEGYYLFLTHDESIALARAILEYTHDHLVVLHEGTDSEIVRTFLLLHQIVEKMHEQ